MGWNPFRRESKVEKEPLRTAYDPAAPVTFQELEVHQSRDSTLKRNIRWLKFIARAATFALAVYGVVSQSIALERYLNTRGIIRNGRNPWSKSGQTIWPTILLLSTSGITVIVSLATLASYWCGGVRSANTINNKAGTPASVIELLAHVSIWTATAVLYRVGKTESDLWGWSCSEKANGIQKLFPEVDFLHLCSMQTDSWYVALAQAALAILYVILYFFAFRRRKQKKRVARMSTMLAGSPKSAGREAAGSPSPQTPSLKVPRFQGYAPVST